MTRHIFRPSGNLFVFLLSAIGVACFSVAASAASVAAGCNANVWTALEAKADAQVAYDAAVTRQMINKPDSVLTLTCFDQAAGVSAVKGGAIFSGDFSTALKTIMPVVAPPFNCNAISTLWTKIATEGVNTGAPYATFDDLANGTVPPGGGADFNAGWTAAKTAGVFNTLKTANAALLPLPPLDFTPAKSSCDVLIIAGIIPGSVGAPCP